MRGVQIRQGQRPICIAKDLHNVHNKVSKSFAFRISRAAEQACIDAHATTKVSLYQLGIACIETAVEATACTNGMMDTPFAHLSPCARLPT